MGSPFCRASPWRSSTKNTMTVTDVLLSEDGHAQERASLGPRSIPHGRAAGEVWVADRNFCTLGLLGAILARGGFFVPAPGTATSRVSCLGQRRSKGRCETGWVYEQRLRLRGEERQVIEVRRITVWVLDKTNAGR